MVVGSNRWKMAGQWFALPKLFKESKNEGYQIVRNDPRFVLSIRDLSVDFLTLGKQVDPVPKRVRRHAWVPVSLTLRYFKGNRGRS